MPHNTPQPLVTTGQLIHCVQPERRAGLMGLLRRSSATMFSEVFVFFPRLGWGKSKLAPIAVMESDGFNSHANNSGVSITGEL